MTLETRIRHEGTKLEIDLDELHRYGQYYLDSTREYIIYARVYTQGTKDSRFVRETQVGTDYTFKPVEVAVDDVQQRLKDELLITVTDREAERIATYYGQGGVEVVSSWADDLGGDRILTKAEYGVISADIDEPLLGWSDEFEGIVSRARAATDLTARAISSKLLHAACDASPGEHGYSARVKLTDSTT